VGLGDRGHDRQAEAMAAIAGPPVRPQAAKGLEEAVDLIGPDHRTAVAHPHRRTGGRGPAVLGWLVAVLRPLVPMTATVRRISADPDGHAHRPALIDVPRCRPDL
jgi:hypothetical protein